MVRYRRGKHLWHRRPYVWRLAAALAVLTCCLTLGWSLRASLVRVLPGPIVGLLGDKALGTSQAEGRHSGSSGPPPRGVVSGAHTVASSTAKSQARVVTCQVFGAAHAGLASSSSAELRKLAQYEQLCRGAVFERSSVFIPTPSNASQAQESAQEVAATLKAYALFGIRPLLFMEPTDLDGASLDLGQYASGSYDSALSAYFSALKATGITATTMGTWIYLPEGNLPVWSTTDPHTYSTVVTKAITLQKQYFPGSQAGIMLDSESYAVGAGWGEGTYVSLLPYVQSIPAGLVNSVGLQGFPWAAPANQPSEGSLYNPKAYLRTDFAVQAAQKLGAKDIWLNTGTFGRMYAGQPGVTVTNTPAQRQQMLAGVIALAKAVKAKGFSAEIHLFAQNKAAMDEGTDWSYWATTPGDSQATTVFTTFAHDAASAGIPLWLYDSD